MHRPKHDQVSTNNMSLYKKMKTLFPSKREKEIALTREDIEELEKIIKASKEAFSGLRRGSLNKEYEEDTIHEIEDTSSDEDDEFELVTQGLRNRSSQGGIAFEVDFEPDRKVKTKPRDIHQETALPKPLIDYTSDEKALMAEIIREDFLAERAVKAAQTDLKRFDANRRRLVMSADAEARIAERKKNEVDKSREAEERDKRLKQLAVKAKEVRLAAASKRSK